MHVTPRLVLLGNAMKISQRGIDLIKAHEGLRLHAYDDGVGVWTIGYGHTQGVQPGQHISEQQAEAFLRDDLYWVEQCLLDSVRVPITQDQHDSLASLIFNIGAGAFQKSTLLRKLNAGDYSGAADEFDKWKHGGGRELPGLVRRRAAEKALFLANSASTPAQQAPYTPPRPDQEPYVTEASMPIPAVFAGAAIDAIFTYAPKLLELFKGGSDVAKRNVEATKILLEVGKAATSASNEQGIVETLQARPESVAALRAEVEKRWFDIHNAEQKATAVSREWIKEYSSVKDVRVVWLNMTFIELLTMFFAITGMFGGLALLMWAKIDGPLQGAIITLMLIESVVGVRKAWIGNTPVTPPAPKE